MRPSARIAPAGGAPPRRAPLGEASRALTGAMLVLAAGCATRSASVDHRMLLPDGARHEIAATQLFVMPVMLDAPEPAFPPGAADAPGEVVVCAEVWLSPDGEVTRVAPSAAPGCADRADARVARYAREVDAAIAGWEFTPAMVCEFPPQALDKRERGDCTGPEVQVRRVPVRLAYAFTFEVRDGRRRVSNRGLPGGG